MKDSLLSEKLEAKPSLRRVLFLLPFLAILLAISFYLFENSAFFETVWRVVIVILTVIIGESVLSRLHTLYILDALELTEVSGLFSKRSIKIPLNRITDYQINRTFFQRILGIGSIYINTPGGLGYELTLKELSHKDLSEISQKLEYLFAQQKIADAGGNDDLMQARKDALEADDGKLDV